jgi:hypothetical protein
MKKAILIICAVIFSTTCFCQSELPDFAPSKEKVIKKVKLDMPLEGRKYKNGTGYSLNPKLLAEMPKKVALVSFYSFDPGMTKTQVWRTVNEGYYWTTVTTNTKVTKRNAIGSSGDLALGYYINSIDVLISQFENYGMDLLLPEEYLDTEEKTEYYNDFKVERAKFNEWIQNMGSGNHDQIYGYPEGYNVLDVVNEPYGNYERRGGKYITRKSGEASDAQVWVMDKCGKMVASLGGDLCSKLEVDAVAIVYFTIFSPKEDKVQLQNVNLHLFGPNPTKLPEGKESKFNYFPGQFYCGTRINPEVLIFNKNKKNPGDELDFRGFDNIMLAMAETMGSYLVEGIEKGKK